MNRRDYIARNKSDKATRYREYTKLAERITVDCDRAFDLRHQLRCMDAYRITPLLVFEWIIYSAIPLSLVALIWLPWWVPVVTTPICFAIAYPSLKQSFADMCFAMYDSGKVRFERMVELGLFVNPAELSAVNEKN